MSKDKTCFKPDKIILSLPSSQEEEESQSEIKYDESFAFEKKALIAIIATIAFSAFTLATGEWSIFTVAGYCLFMLFYPLIKDKYKSGLKEFLSMLALCAVTCLVLNFLVADTNNYIEVVTLVMGFAGLKLVFYPNYEAVEKDG